MDTRCAALIELRCAGGDHRRCFPTACAVAARWHEPVRHAGVEAARRAGATWAVVSTVENRVDVVGTENHLGRARSVLRINELRRAGHNDGYGHDGRVYVVRGTDGGLF